MRALLRRGAVRSNEEDGAFDIRRGGGVAAPPGRGDGDERDEEGGNHPGRVSFVPRRCRCAGNENDAPSANNSPGRMAKDAKHPEAVARRADRAAVVSTVIIGFCKP